MKIKVSLIPVLYIPNQKFKTMFDNIASEAQTNKIATGITSAGVASGVLYGIFKKKGFWGTFGFAVAGGIAGLALGMVVEQFTAN